MVTMEEFQLHWNDFKNNTSTTFSELQKNKEFADVTLACEDGEQIEAHKVILAGGSPFFMNLLKKNKHAHPLIYMKGIKREHLAAMVDFMYKGEAKVMQDNLDSFLASALELQVKGLSGKSTEDIDQNVKVKTKEIKKEPKPKVHENVMPNNCLPKIEPPHQNEPAMDTIPELNKAIETLERIEDEPWNKTADDDFKQTDSDDYTFPTFPLDIQEIDEMVRTMMTTCEGERLTGGQASQGFVRACNVCGKKGSMTNVKDHIESQHMPGISLPCDLCLNLFKSRKALRQHKYKNHIKKMIHATELKTERLD